MPDLRAKSHDSIASSALINPAQVHDIPAQEGVYSVRPKLLVSFILFYFILLASAKKQTKKKHVIKLKRGSAGMRNS